MRYSNSSRGFSLIEIIIAVAIFVLFAGVVVQIFLTSNQSSLIIFNQLEAQGEARRALQDFTSAVRSATYSSIGGYPIESATTTQLVFFSNIDSDTLRERVRYFLVTSTLKRGITKPSGLPMAYPTSTEMVADVVHFIVNTSTPIFSYFDQDYAGTSTPMKLPVDVSKIRMVGVKLIIDKSPSSSPASLSVETQAEIRNLKGN